MLFTRSEVTNARTSQSSAFTRIELLMAVVIIATLTVIVFPLFVQAREMARQTACLPKRPTAPSNFQREIYPSPKSVQVRVPQHRQSRDHRLAYTTTLPSDNSYLGNGVVGGRSLRETTYREHVYAFDSIRASDYSNAAYAASASAAASHRLRVSQNGRFLVRQQDGMPFFYLADTAWELLHRLDREDANDYLQDRAAKGFTVIQAVALAELSGLTDTNPYDDTPLIDNDPTRPDVTPGADPDDPVQYDYWDHVDYIVNRAEELGLYVGLLPTWGQYVTDASTRIFDATNARIYGQFLGERYRDKPVIWILGGDRHAAGYEDVWRQMARGIAMGVAGTEDYSQVLITYHPGGHQTSAQWFHQDLWLDFNMIQSGHVSQNLPNYDLVTSDYDRPAPVKPTIDGEPRYEDHPVNWNPANGYFDDYDVRQAAYWATFAGAHGHTYGHHSIWQMYAPGRPPVSSPIMYWWEGLGQAGGSQMQHVRWLIESRPMLTRIPDQGLIVGSPDTGMDPLRATRASDGSYAFVYLPTGNPVTIDMTKISGSQSRAWWYDPRSGTATEIGLFENTGTQTFTPPSSGRGNDWVLVLDDASWEFPAPGSSYVQQPDPVPPPPDPNFVKGINMFGGAVTIEGNAWVSYEQALTEGLSFPIPPALTTTNITPDPPANADTAEMLNTAVWRPAADLVLRQTIPNGRYDVYLYVMENHESNARSFDVRLEGAVLDSGIGNLALGSWVVHGPYSVAVEDGALDLTLVHNFGDTHLMGLAIFAGPSPGPEAL